MAAERDAFVGRRESLDKLARHVDAGARLVCVTGDDGILLGMVSALDVARHYAVEAGYLVE